MWTKTKVTLWLPVTFLVALQTKKEQDYSVCGAKANIKTVEQVTQKYRKRTWGFNSVH